MAEGVATMPLGEKALNPKTPYFTYEYSVSGKTFYVGITWSKLRAFNRWSHVRNLVRHEAQGTLKPGKTKDLQKKSNQVISCLSRANLKEHEVAISWPGIGRTAALEAERSRIQKLLRQGAKLANVEHNPSSASVSEILAYLGMEAAIGLRD
jgi:hypothetical protein